MEWYLGVAGVVVFLILITLGVRIGFASLIGGLVSFMLVYHGNLNIVGGAIAATFWEESRHYSLTVIPLFIFMGYLIFYSGLGKAIFVTALAWFGRLPGGLAVATVIGNAFFGAVSGSSTAAVALFSKIAAPEMDKYGYAKELSLGSIATAGAMANLIPPSTLIVVYGMLAEQPIGKVLVAGFIPGIVEAAIFSLMIVTRCILNPRLAGPGPRTSWLQKIISLKGVIPVLMIMVILIGGMYNGIFTPTEAGAWSAFTAIVYVIISQRGFKWETFRNALIDSARTTAMIFMIVIGIKVMTTGLIVSGSLKLMIDFFLSLHVSRYVLLAVVSFIYLVLGCFIGVLGMLIMTVPFIVPVLQGVGFDPIWLGIYIIVWCEIGLITPPVGVNVYITAQVTGNDVAKTFRAVWWFFWMEIILLFILILFPGLATWLPSHMK